MMFLIPSDSSSEARTCVLGKLTREQKAQIGQGHVNFGRLKIDVGGFDLGLPL